MDDQRLTNFYERGSGSFQHVRMMSAVPGLTISAAGTQLRDQEIDLADVGSYIRRCLWFASVQVAIFASLSDLLPDGGCGGWPESRAEFGRRWASLWRRMEERYPVEAEAEPTVHLESSPIPPTASPPADLVGFRVTAA